MARPKKEPNPPEVIAGELAAIGCTMGELSAALGLSEDTIRRRDELMAAITIGRERGRTTLRRWQWQAAERGNIVMLIFLGKQMLGQSDRAQVEYRDSNSVLKVPGMMDLKAWAEAARIDQAKWTGRSSREKPSGDPPGGSSTGGNGEGFAAPIKRR